MYTPLNLKIVVSQPSLIFEVHVTISRADQKRSSLRDGSHVIKVVPSDADTESEALCFSPALGFRLAERPRALLSECRCADYDGLGFG
jgi:hypothetical protein